MSEFDDIKKILLNKRVELNERLARLKDNLTSGHSADSQEQAQELENAEVVDALGNEVRFELTQIAKALDKISNGTYGSCGDCGTTIPVARLRAYPFTNLCIECATAREQGRRPR